MGSGFGQSPHLTQELGNAAGIFYVDADYTCMSEEAVLYSQRNVCGKRFSSRAEQLLIFKRKTGQGFKRSLHIMRVSPYRSMYVFVGLGFRSPGPHTLWLHP